MSVYVVTQLTFTDRAAYDRYVARFMDVFSQFDGRVLAADSAPVVLEGEWTRDKVVLLEFPDDAALRAWAGSPAYLEIARDRRAGAEGPILLVHGVSPRA